MPLGVAGILQLNVTLVIVGVEVKSLGASYKKYILLINAYYLELFHIGDGPSPTSLIDARATSSSVLSVAVYLLLPVATF